MGGPCEEPQEHALGDFNPFTSEGTTLNVMPQPNTTEAPQPRPLQSLHVSIGGSPPEMEGREKLDLIEERLTVI